MEHFQGQRRAEHARLTAAQLHGHHTPTDQHRQPSTSPCSISSASTHPVPPALPAPLRHAMWPPTPDHARRLQPALDAEMERRLHERRIHIDKIACVVAFLQIAMGALDAVSRSGCRTLLFGSLALHAAHAWWIFGPRAQWYSTHRTLVAAGLMVVVRLLTALSIQGCNNPTSRVRARAEGACLRPLRACGMCVCVIVGAHACVRL